MRVYEACKVMRVTKFCLCPFSFLLPMTDWASLVDSCSNDSSACKVYASGPNAVTGIYEQGTNDLQSDFPADALIAVPLHHAQQLRVYEVGQRLRVVHTVRVNDMSAKEEQREPMRRSQQWQPAYPTSRFTLKR